MRLEPGLLVTAKVRLVRPLGEGGMGVVWVGEHLSLETQVAVKFLSSALLSRGAQAIDRFHREAKAAAKLKSPHVVTMLDHGITEDGIPYIVMELLEGETLSERLLRGPLSFAEAIEVVLQASRALDEAHAAGTIHRDIKPSNLFLKRMHDELHVKVLDFGIAKALEKSSGDLTLTEGMIGTLHYMSPEQLSDASSVGTSADLWSLAVVAYQALTGTLPFDGVSPVAIHRRMVTESFAPPSQHMGPNFVSLDAWFRRAFAPEPTDRFASARELSATFRSVLAPLDGLAPDSATEPHRAASDAAIGTASDAAIGTAGDAAIGTASDAAMGTAEFVASWPLPARRQSAEGTPLSKPQGADAAVPERALRADAGRLEPSLAGPASEPNSPGFSASERIAGAEPPPRSRVLRGRSLWLGVMLGALVAVLAVVLLQALRGGAGSADERRTGGIADGAARETANGMARETANGTASGMANGAARETANGTASGMANSAAAGMANSADAGIANSAADGATKGNASDSASASLLAASAPHDRPSEQVWPLGCTAAARPCGIGCCITERGCEPGSCDEPLPEGTWELRATKVVFWPVSDEAKKAPLRKADVWLRAGKDGVRHTMLRDRPVRMTTKDLGHLLHAWVQPNEPGLPALLELSPRGLGKTPTRLALCRGLYLRGEVKGFAYWLWLTIVPAGERPAPLCPQTRL
ncbi:MAG: serine/threonine protein kinase [Myxococcales bacterium]|nr:serine/threonine protein kinase [Myxococcales bacterium]